MELKAKITVLKVHHGIRYVDVWKEGQRITVEVYLPQGSEAHFRAQLDIQLQPDEQLESGDGRSIYEALKNTVVLQYWCSNQSVEALKDVKSQLLALGAFADLKPPQDKSRLQLKRELGVSTDVLFSFIANRASMNMASS